ncbi:hypothetical protein [Kitasatospora xanthocidica]|uniref:hypothetical protein n=1 Tax=Kitasatospora xanthocidica TaxID=83382 RepID=UPI0016795430|nr:hypothetical protein [Kitasatospora xanthocidica]
MSMRGSGEDQWEDFVKEFEKEKAAGGGSAAAAEQAPQPERGRSGRRLLLPVAAALLVVAGAAAYALRPSDQAPAAAPAASGTAAPAPATQPIPAAPAASGTPASATETAMAAAASPSAFPLSVLPGQVQGYTLVAGVARTSCTGPDTVAPTLAGLITQGHGCLGVNLALYKDAEGNQYNVALFTMADQGDGVHLVTFLASHPESFQVAVHVPPTDSGLRRLPADRGRVQDFAAHGHGVLVGSAQWSDGRTADLDKLSERLTPLTEAVLKNVPA